MITSNAVENEALKIKYYTAIFYCNSEKFSFSDFLCMYVCAYVVMC